MMIKLTL